MSDDEIIRAATEKTKSILVEDWLSEIRIPVFKPMDIKIKGEYPTFYAEMQRPYYLVYFTRDLQERNKWNFKKLDK